mgnify:CR=1 FL=1
MRVAIGCDHAGYDLKEYLKSYLEGLGHEWDDKGTNGPESTDYPEYAHAVADAVAGGDASKGIVICGSGNGVAMSANKHGGIRCALCWTPEIAELARQHNDANVLAIPARFVTRNEAAAMVKTFLNTDFEGGRHQRRVEKIARS